MLTPIDQSIRRNAVLDAIRVKSGITKAGGFADYLTEELLDVIEQVELEHYESINEINPLTASGPFLELWAEFFDIDQNFSRRAFSLASDENVYVQAPNGLTFGDLNDGNDIILENIVISGANQLNTEDAVLSLEAEFELTDPSVTLPAGESLVYIGVIASRSGSEGNISENSLRSIGFSDYSQYPALQLQVGNRFPIQNGEDDYGDEELSAAMSRLHFGKDRKILDVVVNEIDEIAGISNVDVIDSYSHPSSIDFFIDSESFVVGDPLVTAAEGILEQHDLGHKAYVHKVERIGVAIETNISFRNLNLSEKEKDETVGLLEVFCYNYLVQIRNADTMDFVQLEQDILTAFPQIARVGSDNFGFDEVRVYKNYFASYRNFEVYTEDTLEVELNQRILPEDSIVKPFIFKVAS